MKKNPVQKKESTKYFCYIFLVENLFYFVFFLGVINKNDDRHKQPKEIIMLAM